MISDRIETSVVTSQSIWPSLVLQSDQIPKNAQTVQSKLLVTARLPTKRLDSVFVCICLCLYVSFYYGSFRKPSSEKIIFGVRVHLRGIQVKFVYEGHWLLGQGKGHRNKKAWNVILRLPGMTESMTATLLWWLQHADTYYCWSTASWPDVRTSHFLIRRQTV